MPHYLDFHGGQNSFGLDQLPSHFGGSRVVRYMRKGPRIRNLKLSNSYYKCKTVGYILVNSVEILSILITCLKGRNNVLML